MRYSIIGGDLRFARLRDILTADGHSVRSFALGAEKDEKTLSDALGGADCVILPLPMLGKNGTLNAPLYEKSIALEELKPYIGEKTLVLGGSVMTETPFPVTDYFRREELTVKNAALTAEGAVRILMSEMEIALTDSKIVIAGAGRIGKLLAVKLRALGAEVTVTARKEGDLALIRELGCDWCRTENLRLCAREADALVNTVPARIIDASVLRSMKKEAILLDLASSPFGHDPDEAAALGVRSMFAPGLPGRAAPRSAAMAIRDTIYNIVNERECSG